MSNINIPASDFRVNFKSHIAAVNAGSTVTIEKHGKAIAMLVPASAVSNPDIKVSATSVRVDFSRLLADLSAGSTIHITKHKSILAALVAPDFGASEPVIEEAPVETIEEEEVVEVPVSKPLSAREAAKADMADDDDFFGDDDDADEDEEEEQFTYTAMIPDISEATLDMAADTDDGHDWLDEEHDDVYDAFFAELAQCRNTRMQRRASTR
jgi:antitoxin (DNA-binding transcriptional repressor) of toxin-antitoxin stability system